MCTLAWGQTTVGCWLCFNRDEQRTRPPAERPVWHAGPHGPIAYARDPEGGGTWLAVSARGYLVAVLNHYPEAGQANVGGERSRGRLVSDLARGASVADARATLIGAPHRIYAPFRLLLLDRSGVTLTIWNGKRLRTEESPEPFQSTSSFQQEALVDRRKAWWASGRPDLTGNPEQVAARLKQPCPSPPAAGVTMDREDARTVSQVLVTIGANGAITFAYWARESEGTGYEPPIELIYPDPKHG